MDDQERPTTDADEGSEPKSDNSTMRTLGIIFIVVGIGLFVGPGSAGIPFIAIGVVFLASSAAQKRR
ncbi:hypothetical protein [Cellulomonas sp. P5_C5]